MFLLLLALCVLQEPNLIEVEVNKGTDLEFVAAIEDFAMKDNKPPSVINNFLYKMDSNCYHCREVATKKFKKFITTSGQMQYLFWGRKYPSLEVRIRCNRILRELNPCGTCKGAGRSIHYIEDPCWNCGGVGSDWIWPIFNK